MFDLARLALRLSCLDRTRGFSVGIRLVGLSRLLQNSEKEKSIVDFNVELFDLFLALLRWSILLHPFVVSPLSNESQFVGLEDTVSLHV